MLFSQFFFTLSYARLPEPHCTELISAELSKAYLSTQKVSSPAELLRSFVNKKNIQKVEKEKLLNEWLS